MRRPFILAVLLLALAPCANGPPGHWNMAGDPIPEHGQQYIQAAEELASCRLDSGWGGVITFYPAPFLCGFRGDPKPGRLCNGTSWTHVININALEGSLDGVTPNLPATTLAYELANAMGTDCWPRSYQEGVWTNEMTARIIVLAEELIANLPPAP